MMQPHGPALFQLDVFHRADPAARPQWMQASVAKNFASYLRKYFEPIRQIAFQSHNNSAAVSS